MRLRAWPLSRLLVLAFTLITLLSMLPAALLNAFETRELLRSRGLDRLHRRAEITAERMDDEVRDLVRWADELERRPEVRALLDPLEPVAGERGRAEAALFKVLHAAERLHGIFIADAGGKVLAETGRTQLPLDLAGWAPFRRALGGETVVLPRAAGRHDARFLILVPIRIGNAYAGVVGIEDDFRDLAGLVEDDFGALGRGTHGVLTDEHGIAIVHGLGAAHAGKPFTHLPPEVVAELETEGRRRGRSPPAAEDRGAGYTASASLVSAPWTYSVTAPRAYFEGPARRQFERAALSGVLVLGLAVALSMGLARSLARPFTELEATIAAWRAGRRGVRVPALGTREAERLSAAFNQMAEEIESYERELQAKVAERTAALEAANRELELFSYSASHDLRAPLRAIDGFTASVLEDYGDVLPAEGRAMLERVEATVDRMRALIDDLLMFGRVSRQTLHHETVDLSALAGEIAAELDRQSSGRRVRCTIADGLTAVGDPSLLRVVFDNLLGNAWKYTARREEARIEVGSLGRRGAEGETILFVRDNGAGFDMAHAGQLFTPFRRLHPSSEFPGTGIGLATAQRIIERHGGRIWAEAEIDRGATFYFTLGVPSGA